MENDEKRWNVCKELRQQDVVTICNDPIKFNNPTTEAESRKEDKQND